MHRYKVPELTNVLKLDTMKDAGREEETCEKKMLYPHLT
jgi:hypothetical protein